MNILFLCKKVPYPPTDGESIVIMNDLQILKAIGHRVFLSCLNTKKHWVDTKGYDKMEIWDGFEQYPIHTNGLSTLWNAFLASQPFQIARFYAKNIDRKIEYFIKSNAIDLVIYQGLATSQYLALQTIPKVYRVHNVEHKIWFNLAHNSHFFLKKILQRWIANTLKTYETQQLNVISSFMTLSIDEEKEIEKWYPKANVSAIPITLFTHLHQVYEPTKKGLLFIGSLDWKPNREGLNWFLQQVYPAISHIPLTIAGKGNFSCNYENVTVVSDFENSFELMSNHRMLIVPLLSGAGIRIKILEAMKFGMPILSTPIGAEGIQQVEGTVMIQKSSNEWIHQIESMYLQPQILIEMSALVKESFQTYYSEEAIASQWNTFLQTIQT